MTLMKTNRLVMFAAATLCAGSMWAAVSPQKAAWAKGPVQFMLTPQEVNAWSALKTDEEADAFIASFWARRDPTPGTAVNEFRDDFDARVAYADDKFKVRGVRGATSDRGRMLILFGTPSRSVRSGAGEKKPFGRPVETSTAPGTDKLRWLYEGETTQKMFGASRVELHFTDRLGNGDMRLDPPAIDLKTATDRMINAVIAPTPSARVAAAPIQNVAPPLAEPAPATLPTPLLETAIKDAKAGKVPRKDAVVTAAEFLSPGGEYYVPIGIFVPASAGLTADSFDTFFGIIEDATGKRVEAFEVPAKPTMSRNSLLFDHTTSLPSGTYTATLGLAKAGAPVLMASGQIPVKVVAKEFVGTSRLILSDIIETIEAAPVKAPFAFGKLKIVPRTTFTNKDELGYFVELHNPGVDPTTNLPKMQAKIDLVRPSGPPISAPLSDVQALPLSGAPGPGEYAIISGIPLSELTTPLAPGDYTLRVKVVDTVTKQSYTVEQKFKIVS